LKNAVPVSGWLESIAPGWMRQEQPEVFKKCQSRSFFLAVIAA